MLFTLEALEALHGDSLILHYGDKNDPRFIVIDGGPPKAYEQSLKPRLDQIKARWHPSQPLPVEMVMVSHIDRDHVYGVLRMAKDIEKQQKIHALQYDVLTLWHNSFDDIIGNDQDGLLEAMVAAVQVKDDGVVAPASLKNPDAGLVLASVAEARDLRLSADALDIPVNTGFQRLVMAPEVGKKVVNWGDGLKFTIVGPEATRLAKLQEEWDKELRELKKKGKLKPAEAEAIAAAYADKTAENLSSIVVLAEFDDGAKKKKMLLTGDARGDFIQEGLKAAGLLKNGKIHVDLLKLPHHGSIRNFAKDFFENVTADHYVISANGDFGNPDNETLEMLSHARPDGDFTIHLTNRICKPFKKQKDPQRLVKFFDGEKAAGKKYKVKFRDDDALSLKVDLLEKVNY
jgi:hypothetical protein